MVKTVVNEEIDIDIETKTSVPEIDIEVTSSSANVELDANKNDYNELYNKPRINGYTLIGDKTGEQLALTDLSVFRVEVAERIAADANLQKQIDAINERPNIVDIVATKEDLTNYPTTKLTVNDVILVAKDESRKGYLTSYRWVDNAWVFVTETVVSYTKEEIDAMILAEKTAREAADAQLQANINAEETARKEADKEEKEERVAADTQLQENINAEETARKEADATEKAERIAAIKAEETARKAADEEEKQERSEAIATEKAERIASDEQLQANIVAEEASRKAADNVLQANIDAEKASREAADTQLQENINTEASQRQAADTQLQANIDTKVTKNESIVASTHTKISYDSKGLVTGGSNLEESDIPDLHLAKVVDVTVSANEVNYLDGVTSNVQEQINSKVNTADIIDDTYTAVSNKPLSANMGKELQDQVNNLKAIGRFLSLWNCTTGLPTTEPTTMPYSYHTGDYFIVSVVGETNYKPNGSQYTGEASTTVETGEVNANDIYFYDSTSWKLLSNTQKTITFANIAGSWQDNASLVTGFAGKVDVNETIVGATKTKITYDSKGLVTGGSDLEESDIPNIHLAKVSDVTASATEVNYLDGVTSNVQEQLDSKAVYPDQEGKSGKFLKTDGENTSWETVDALPPQAGKDGRYLRTDGTNASWEQLADIPVIDNKSITQNSESKIQTVGVINQNATTTALKVWSGTNAEYEAIETKDANTLYHITDDSQDTRYTAGTGIDITDNTISIVQAVGDILWEQPVLTEPGTMGVSDFAVDQSTYYVYTGYDVRAYQVFGQHLTWLTNHWQANDVSTSDYNWVSWYTKTAVKITSIIVTNSQGEYSVKDYIFEGSDDNSNWTELATGTNDNVTYGGQFTVSCSSNTTYYHYYRLRCKARSSISIQIHSIYITGYVNYGTKLIAKATNSLYGLVKPDGTSITVNDGVISASAVQPTYDSSTETISF